VLENRILSRIIGSKRNEVMGKWRKLYNGKLHNLYSSPNVIRQIKSRRMKWARHVVCSRKDRKVYKVLVGKPQGKGSLKGPGQRWEKGIKMDLRRVWNGFTWLRIGMSGRFL
jgi:hypothetical protein